MGIDSNYFYDSVVRAFQPPFHLKLDAPKRRSFDAIFKAWDDDDKLNDLRWLAYMLGTAYYETQFTMSPVRETLAKTDAEARRNLGDAKYAQPAANGHAYYGRGFVQLTWDYNYKSVGEKLGLGAQLYDNPDLALDAEIAARVLVGWFTIEGIARTGATIGDYLSDKRDDWDGARNLVNGDGDYVKKWDPQNRTVSEIVKYCSRQFLECLKNEDVEPERSLKRQRPKGSSKGFWGWFLGR